MTGLKEDYVKNGKMNKEMGKLYSHLFDWRQETDYADFVEFDRETIEPLLEEVKKLNITLKGLFEK